MLSSRSQRLIKQYIEAFKDLRAQARIKDKWKLAEKLPASIGEFNLAIKKIIPVKGKSPIWIAGYINENGKEFLTVTGSKLHYAISKLFKEYNKWKEKEG